MFATSDGEKFLRAVLAAAAQSFSCDGVAMLSYVNRPTATRTEIDDIGDPELWELADSGRRLVDVARQIEEALGVGAGGELGERLDVEKLARAIDAYRECATARARARRAFVLLMTRIAAAARRPAGHA